MIVIHAHLKVKPQQREEFLQMAQEVIKGSQAEEGNIMYQLCEVVGEPNSFIVVEEWKDEAAIEFHRQTGHFVQFMGGVQDMLAEPTRVDIFEAKKHG